MPELILELSLEQKFELLKMQQAIESGTVPYEELGKLLLQATKLLMVKENNLRQFMKSHA